MKLIPGRSSACLILVFTSLLLNCSDDADVEKTSAKPTNLWADGFPQIRPGATTLDFDMQPNYKGDVHYILSKDPLALSREELIAEATLPTNTSIIKTGTLTLLADERKKETITGLSEKTNLYAYLISADTSIGKQEEWLISKDVTTKVRQDTSQFYSASEARNSYYLLYAPEETLKYPEEKYPIIYYTAGAGEKSLTYRTINVIRNGTLTQYLANGNDVPMMVFTIQHITDLWNEELVGDAVAYAKENLPVDVKRQYLVGSSAGAFATWDYGLAHPGEFAAIVPISGGGKSSLACNAKNLAVWAFHNQPDTKVSPSRSITLINDILACTPEKEVKLLLFNDSGHNCWRRVFDPNHPDWESMSPDVPRVNIYDWLLQFSRPQN
jgi:predicted peptidase